MREATVHVDMDRADQRIYNFLEEMKRDLDTKFSVLLNRISSVEDTTTGLEDKIEQTSAGLAELTNRVAIMEGEKIMDKNEEIQASNVSNRSSARKTKFQTELEEAAKRLEEESAHRMVVYNMPAPEYKHIRLNSTDIAEFSIFLINWLEWERTYGIKLEPPRIIARPLRTMLQYNHGLTDAEFFRLSADGFMKLMAQETKVMSKKEFSDTMSHALRFVKQLDWEKVTPSTHQKFYQQILRRKEIFMKVFQILMESNSKYCPDLKGKPYGLAYLFMNTISTSYNESIRTELGEINNSRFPKIEDFVSSYCGIAREHYMR